MLHRLHNTHLKAMSQAMFELLQYSRSFALDLSYFAILTHDSSGFLERFPCALSSPLLFLQSLINSSGQPDFSPGI